MSEWITRISNHPLHARLQEISNLIESVDEKASSDVAALEALSRIRTVIRYVSGRLEVANPLLVPQQHLAPVDADLVNIVNFTKSFANDGRAVHLHNAANHCDHLLLHTNAALSATDSKDLCVLKEAAAAYRTSVGLNLKHAEDELAALEKKFADLSKVRDETLQDIQGQKGRLDKAIADFQQQFSSAQQERLQSYSKEVLERQSSAKKAEDQRESTFTNAFSSFENSARSFLKIAGDNHAGFQTELHSDTAELLEGIKAEKGRAEKLVGIIANTGMTGGYQKVAKQEGLRSNVWHVIAMLMMAGLILFAILLFTYTLADHEIVFSWGKFGARVVVVVAFAFAAAYAGRQADKHRSNERCNRRLELVLASISPYLSDLPEAEQHRLRASMVERIFATTDPPAHEEKDIVPATTLYDLLRLAIQNLTKK